MGQLLHTSRRRRVCAWLAAAVLMVQWLVAAHACPLPGVHTLEAPVAVQAAAAPCHDEASADDTALCMAHCSDAQQAPSQPVTADTEVHASGWCLVMALPVLQPQGSLPAPRYAVRVAAPPGWPPLYLVHGVLRI